MLDSDKLAAHPLLGVLGLSLVSLPEVFKPGLVSSGPQDILYHQRPYEFVHMQRG